MWNEDEFFNEFRKNNDGIKPDENFKAQLSAMVAKESSKKVIPFYRDIKKMSAIAASVAVVVIVGSIFGGNLLRGSSNSSASSVSGDKIGIEAGANAAGADDEGDSNSHDFNAQAINVNAIVDDILAGAEVTSDDVVLNKLQTAEVVGLLKNCSILNESSSEEPISVYLVDGSSTWVIEVYPDNEIYICKK